MEALEKKRKDYAFWRQFDEKPSIILGCPKDGSATEYLSYLRWICLGCRHFLWTKLLRKALYSSLRHSSCTVWVSTMCFARWAQAAADTANHNRAVWSCMPEALCQLANTHQGWMQFAECCICWWSTCNLCPRWCVSVCLPVAQQNKTLHAVDGKFSMHRYM